MQGFMNETKRNIIGYELVGIAERTDRMMVNMKDKIAERSKRKSIETPLNITFLSRICPQKNLLGAIKSLCRLEFEVEFTIYGPEEDKGYWLKCKNELENLPANIHWFYKGDVLSDEVQTRLQMHDIFLLPTRGENYGHVIFEALSVGCIPVISDQTPWHVIAEKKAGYVLPLSENMTEFVSALRELHNMGMSERNKMADRAVRIAIDKVEQAKKNTGYRKIFG